MPTDNSSGLRGLWASSQGLIFPILIVTSLLVIITPMPAVVMDLLLAANITLSVVILLTTIYVKRPLEFSVFPSLLLAKMVLSMNGS